MAKHADGVFEVFVPGLAARCPLPLPHRRRGPYPDPASRFQPEGVHGPSEVVDPARFAWTDGGWCGVAAADLVIYELHVGTFSPEGTFDGVTSRLPDLARLGVTAIELMPVADFPGRRNWGYDGVDLFAPARCYGTPGRPAPAGRRGSPAGARCAARRGLQPLRPGRQLPGQVLRGLFLEPAQDPVGAGCQPRWSRQRGASARSSSRTCCTGCKSTTSTACAWMPPTVFSTPARGTSSPSWPRWYATRSQTGPSI